MDNSKIVSGERFSPRVVLLVWAAALFLLALRPIEAFDTFWQLQSGKYIWQTGAFLYRDTFSITANAFRLEHCWFSDLVFYGLYSLGGYTLLGLLKPLVITLCGGLLYRWNVRRGVAPEIAVPVLLLCLLASAPSWLVRPQLWTFLISLLFIRLLYRGREGGWRTWLWLVPLMVLWANLHAACIFGLALIGFFWLGEALCCWRKKAAPIALLRLAGVGLLTLGATFVNPYGHRIPMQLLDNIKLYHVHNLGKMGNMEWLPPSFHQVPLFYVVMALWGGLLLFRLRRQDPVEVIFFLAFLYMGVNQVRHTTLVALLAGYFLPGQVSALLTSLWGQRRRPGWLPAAAGSAVLLLVAAVLLQAGLVKRVLGWGLHPDSYPVAATTFLKKHHLPGGLYNSYDWGGYLMWRLFPAYKVFVDGRSDSMRTFRAMGVVDDARPGWQGIFARYGINSVLTRTCYYDTGAPLNLVDNLVHSSAWALVYQDPVALVFVRRDLLGEVHPALQALPSRAAYQTMYDEGGRLYREDNGRYAALLAMGRASINLGAYRRALAALSRYQQVVPGNKDVDRFVRLLRER